MYRDELSGWLLNFTRYANGGSDREFWLESCEGRTYVSERQGRGSTRIERFSVAITGGIQPDKLRNGLLKAGDDGLLARFLPIWPHPAPLHRDPPLLDNRLAESAFERLLGIEMATDDKGRATPNLVQFTEAARDSHFNWCASIREREADGLLKSFIGKTPGFVARIALVLAALDWALTTDAARPRIVTREHIDRARTYVATYLIPMAERSYAEASISPDIRNANKIAHFIKSEQPASISIRDVQRKKWSGMLQVHEIEKAFNVLIECDWLRERKTQTAGRPRREFQVNPILLRRSDLNRTGC